MTSDARRPQISSRDMTRVGSETLSAWAVTTESQRVANDYDEDHPIGEFIVEIANRESHHDGYIEC
jgi:hypothetical protein